MNQEISQESNRKKRNFKHKMDIFVNTKLSIWGSKIAGQRHIAALRDSFVGYSAFVVVGSFFMIIGNFPIPAWADFLKNTPWLDSVLTMPKRVTFDLMSVWIAALFAYNLSRTYKMNPVFPMIGAVAFFILLMPLELVVPESGEGKVPGKWTAFSYIPFGGYAGTNGILLALISGIVITEFFKFCRDKNVRIPLPQAVPPAVTGAFSAMIPIVFLISFGILFRGLFGLTQWHYLPVMIENFLAAPISQNFIGQMGGVVLVTFLGMFGWCFGINSSAVNGVIRPFWIQLIPGNTEAYAIFQRDGIYHWAGEKFIGTDGQEYVASIGVEDFFNFINNGGAGATVGIVIILALFAKSEKIRTIARVSIIPGIFNINEPFLFGIPVVLNPMMWLPLIGAPVLATIVAYGAIDLHLVNIPIGLMNPWTLPMGVLGYFTNMHWTGPVLQIFCLLIETVFWWPFVKFADQEEFKKENHLENVKTTQTFKVAKRLGILPPVFGRLKNTEYFEKLTAKKPYNVNYANILQQQVEAIKTVKQGFAGQLVSLEDELNLTLNEKNLSKEEIKILKEKSKNESKIIRELMTQEVKLTSEKYQDQISTARQEVKINKESWNQDLKIKKKEMKEQIKILKIESKENLHKAHQVMKEEIYLAKKNEEFLKVEKIKGQYRKQKLEEHRKILDAQYIFEKALYGETPKLRELKSTFYKQKYTVQKPLK